MILVCAATGTEAAACRRGIADSGASEFTVLTTGVGPERAAATLAGWLARRPDVGVGSSRPAPTLVVSAGFAGALTPDLESLAWITASSVYELRGDRPVPVALPPVLLWIAERATPCHVVSADRVLARSISGAGRPAAVDMESAALAGVAADAALAFAVLRMVTDTPLRPLAALGHRLAATFSAEGVAARAGEGARAAVCAARSPVAALTFVRDGIRWRDLLRRGWRERAVPLQRAWAAERP